MAMAHPAVYGQQAKGTLMPGQMITVNKYNVQVERFLSQGGFAHVYLVRTAEPVFGTTHHVLKRIAVANEAMLNEVKKEVDIMRILRGHPNIVYLLDAAWNKMLDGMFEVFILMEFCQGGGIIDMMNRRLRERLTEAEILQIFVDVCEGVAAMHNLRPALLHRDLKVENILQASATSYKLCDFGSAVPVTPKPPQTTQEIRALEADLNKHTTLQYRAPEMVDVFLRRPVDEKSDVWALGVLLYKLCYYTTPFEEHGVLAILNVQYKFPPYPVYSQQLNEVIASMLREHGVHRPTVFEVLDNVHKMRGTKSRFTYAPRPPKPLSPKKQPSQLAPSGTTSSSGVSPESPGPSMNGIQAREKVLEAIAPMRRGRPTTPTSSVKPTNDAFHLIDSLESGPWKSQPVKAYKSGIASMSFTRSGPSATAGNSLGQAWEVKDSTRDRSPAAEPARGFADSFSVPSSSTKPISIPAPKPNQSSARPISSLRPPGDAFDSLNIFPSPKAPALTLGEAQKAGLTAPRPTPSPQPSSGRFSASPAASIAPSPVLTGPSPSSFRRDSSPLMKPQPTSQNLSVEQRFPSLEELDQGSFGSSYTTSTMKPARAELVPPRLPPRPSVQDDNERTSFYPASVTGALRPSLAAHSALSVGQRPDGVRSQHVTGTAMKDVRKVPSPSRPSVESPSLPARQTPPELPARKDSGQGDRGKLERINRPMLTRKHRSSVSIRNAQRTGSDTRSPSPKKVLSQSPKKQATDWLTGVDDTLSGDPSAVLRASPEKRMSISQSPVPLNIGQEAVRATSPVKRKPVPSVRPKPLDARKLSSEDDKENEGAVGFGLTENWNSASPKMEPKALKDSSSSDEGPEDAVASLRKAPKGMDSKFGHKARSGSVHDLVDLWGGSSSPQFQKTFTTPQEKRSSTFMTKLSGEMKSPESKPTSSPARANLTSPSKSRTESADTPERQAIARSAHALSRQASTSSKGPSTNHLRQPSSPARPRQTPSSGGRSRPQSMLIMPVQKSVSENTSSGLPSPSLQANLSPPPKLRSAGRRSSISDLVSRYESININATGGGGAGSGQVNAGSGIGAGIGMGPPPLAAKPMRLRMASSTASAVSENVPSPSAAATRFPKLSPNASPVLSKVPLRTSPPSSPVWTRASLDLPQGSRPFGKEDTQPSNNRSPGSSPRIRPSTPVQKTSPLLRASELTSSPRVRPLGLGQSGVPSAFARDRAQDKPESAPTFTADTPRGQLSNVLEQRKQLLAHVTTPTPGTPGTPAKEQTVSSGDEAPETPYQGVSKLINQWQKKSEEAEGPRGGVGGFKGPGTGSRFRTGLAAGGKVA